MNINKQLSTAEYNRNGIDKVLKIEIHNSRVVNINTVEGVSGSLILLYFISGYFGVTMPPLSVKLCHFERSCNDSNFLLSF